MDPKKISELANLLRNNGDKVLSSEFKLTLSGSLLRALNDSFTLIADQTELCSPQSFQVVKPNNSKSEVFRDLQLVHDFVQKTLLLCIAHFPGDEYFEGKIDITKFRSLKCLEVQRTNVKQIVGIQPLRAQLQQLVCTRSVNAIEDIITHCGGDRSNGFVWNELKLADFSYNNLKSVDHALEFAQYLQILNLSHNQLTSVEAVKWLPNLKTLDLSFNRLVIIPNFHIETSKRLQVLNVSNNFIEDLDGISKLDSITELNLADNCLLDHTYLIPLSALMTLKYLNLYGNPLHCHPKHRLATAQFLHKNTSTVKFILDFEPLSKKEKLVTGKNASLHNKMFPSRYMVKSSGQSTPNRASTSNTPASSVGSLRSFRFESDASEMSTSITEKTKKRPKNRTVIIEDTPRSNTSPSLKLKNNQDAMRTNLEGNKEHLETKKQIEDLRSKYGAGWLQTENAQLIHSVLGIEESAFSVQKKLTSQQMLEDFIAESNKSTSEMNDTTIMTSTPVDGNTHFDLTAQNETPIKTLDSSCDVQSVGTVYVSATEDNNQTVYQSIRHEETGPDLNEIYGSNYEEPEASDPEDNEVSYKVRRNDSTEELLLTVSDVSIKEKDISTGITKKKWSLKILESCERSTSSTIRVHFDTMRKDKKERVYTLDEDLCQELEKYLRDILSKRGLSEMNQTIYRCVNCTCQFSREIKYKRIKSDVFCPECRSTFVVEIHDSSTESPQKSANKPAVKDKPELPLINADSYANSTESGSPALQISAPQGAEKSSSGEKINSNEDSSSHSSIGKGGSRLSTNKQLSSAGSLNESSSCSKISNSESSFDSNQSIAGSSSNERENDFKQNCDSDVEILSNPSQSSIEVLDQVYSSRKTSEERRISQTPNLETIHDQIVNNYTDNVHPDEKMATEQPPAELIEKKTLLSHMNLTESSSSGSVTDSICTAYEQSSTDGVSSDGKHSTASGSSKRSSEKEESKKEESIISSMLGGLFQSRSKLDTTIVPCNKFKFNYSDFSDIDHRLKLYFYQQKFEDEREHFKWIVKGKVYNEASSTLCDGIIVMSTTKFYLMEIFAPENDDISKWLRQLFSVTVDRIEEFQLLPWKIGFSIRIKSWGGFLLILQDILRTDSLLLYFANNPLPMQCTLEYQISANILKKLSRAAKDEQVKMLSIINQCQISSDHQSSFSPAAFFTTDTRLYLTTSNMSWLSGSADANLELALTQPMSNLVEVDKTGENAFSINFLDETQNKIEWWKCTFETKENAESCLNAIGQSWEKLFGVPLVGN